MPSTNLKSLSPRQLEILIQLDEARISGVHWQNASRFNGNALPALIRRGLVSERLHGTTPQVRITDAGSKAAITGEVPVVSNGSGTHTNGSAPAVSERIINDEAPATSPEIAILETDEEVIEALDAEQIAAAQAGHDAVRDAFFGAVADDGWDDVAIGIATGKTEMYNLEPYISADGHHIVGDVDLEAYWRPNPVPADVLAQYFGQPVTAPDTSNAVLSDGDHIEALYFALERMTEVSRELIHERIITLLPEAADWFASLDAAEAALSRLRKQR